MEIIRSVTIVVTVIASNIAFAVGIEVQLGEQIQWETREVGQSVVYSNATIGPTNKTCLAGVSSEYVKEADGIWKCYLVPSSGTSVLRYNQLTPDPSGHPSLLSVFISGLDLSKSSRIKLPRKDVRILVVDLTSLGKKFGGLQQARFAEGLINIDRHEPHDKFLNVHLQLKYKMSFPDDSGRLQVGALETLNKDISVRVD